MAKVILTITDRDMGPFGHDKIGFQIEIDFGDDFDCNADDFEPTLAQCAAAAAIKHLKERTLDRPGSKVVETLKEMEGRPKPGGRLGEMEK